MKKLRKTNLYDSFDILYSTLLFSVVSIIILLVINYATFFILKTMEANIYYVLIKGALWIPVSLLFGLLFSIVFDKKDLIIKNESDLSKNLLYMFVTMLIVTALSGLVYMIGMNNIPPSTLDVMENKPLSNIGNYNSILSKISYIIALLIATLLNAAGEELFIRYIAYKKLAKKNSGKKLRIKFIITTSLAFGIYHGLFIFINLSKTLGVTRFILTFIISVGICLVFLKTKNIIYVILMHALINFTGLSGLPLVITSIIKDYTPSSTNIVFIEWLSVIIVYLVITVMILLYRYVKKLVHK